MKLFEMFFFLFIEQTFIQSWCDTIGYYTLAYVPASCLSLMEVAVFVKL